MYGGAGVEYSPEAEKKIELYTRLGFDKLPDLHGQDASELELTTRISRARPPASPSRCATSAPASARASSIPLLGTMSTMPGLSTRPGYYDIDLDLATGKIIGLS